MLHGAFRARLSQRWSALTAKPEFAGYLALSVNILGASTYTPFAKELTTIFPSLTLLLVSECLSVVLLLMVYGAVPIGHALRKMPREVVLPLLVVGLLSGTFGPLLWFTGLAQTTGLNASLFSNIDLVFIMHFASTMLGERMTHEHVMAALCIGVGTAVIATRGVLSGSFSMQPGDIILILSSVCYSLGCIIYRRYLHEQKPHLVLFVRSLTGLVSFALFLPFTGAAPFENIHHFSFSHLSFLLGFALVSRLIPILAFYHAIERISVSAVSLLSTLSVIGGAGLSSFFFGEKLFSYHYVGALFVLLGTVLFEVHSLPDPRRLLQHFRPHHPDLLHTPLSANRETAPA